MILSRNVVCVCVRPNCAGVGELVVCVALQTAKVQLVCVCMNRCRPPLCVKLENPKLSRKECDHSLYCFLLHSNKCVYVCVRERDGIRETNDQQGNKSESQGGEKEQIRPRCNSVTHTHADKCCVRFQSDLREGVCCRHQRSHEQNMLYIMPRRCMHPIFRNTLLFPNTSLS